MRARGGKGPVHQRADLQPGEFVILTQRQARPALEIELPVDKTLPPQIQHALALPAQIGRAGRQIAGKAPIRHHALARQRDHPAAQRMALPFGEHRIAPQFAVETDRAFAVGEIDRHGIAPVLLRLGPARPDLPASPALGADLARGAAARQRGQQPVFGRVIVQREGEPILRPLRVQHQREPILAPQPAVQPDRGKALGHAQAALRIDPALHPQHRLGNHELFQRHPVEPHIEIGP